MTIFFRILILILFSTPFWCFAQQPEDQLNHADSLFKNQRYTEALEVYQALHDQGMISSAMLIKMAYINEGLGNETKAIYYLDQYYKKSNNRQALEKLRELANEYNLSGYEHSDEKFFINRLRTYRMEIIISLLALITILLVAIVIKKVKGVRAIPWLAAQIILTILSLTIINQAFTAKEAIINLDNTLLMQGPSPASKPINSLKAGNKVNILNPKDVWTQVEVDGQKGFIKSNRLESLL